MLLLPLSTSPLSRRLARTGVWLSLAAGLILAAALPSAARAGGKAKPRPPFLPPYAVIESVDTAKKTITVGHVNSKDTSSKTYTLSDTCEIEVNGVKAQIDALKAGLKVDVGIGMDPTTASRIVAGPVPPPPPAPRK